MVISCRRGAGASGEQLLNKVEQWLDSAEAPTDAGPPVAEPLSPTASKNSTRRRQAGADFSAGAPALAVRAFVLNPHGQTPARLAVHSQQGRVCSGRE